MNRSFVALCISPEGTRLAEISQENGERVVRGLWHWKSSEDNHVQTRDLIRGLLEDGSIKARNALLVIGSEELSYRDFSFPFSSSRKVMSAIRFETSAEYPPEEYIFEPIEVISGDPGRKAFLVAIVKKDTIREKIRYAEAAGLRITGVTSDISGLGHYFVDENEALVMDVGQRQTLFVLYSHRVPMIVRGIPIGLKDIHTKETGLKQEGLRSLASEMKRTILSFNARTDLVLDRLHLSGSLLEHRPLIAALKETVDCRFIDQPPESGAFRITDRKEDLNLYAALLGTAGWKKSTKAFDFFKDESFQADTAILRRTHLKWGTVVLVSLLCAVLLSSWLKIITLHKRERFLAAETRKVFAAAFPQVKKIVDEVRQARNLIEARKAGLSEGSRSSSISLLEVMERMSVTIPRDVNFQIVNLFWERGRVEIDGRTDSFKSVNRIQELLAKSQGFPDVTISNAKTRSDNQNVEFKITIRIAG